jgi:NADH-quinone oxidoreductase subunit N
MLMLPEILVIATAFAVLLADLFVTERQRPQLVWLALAGVASAAVVLVGLTPDTGAMFGGRYAMDTLAWWIKLTLLVAAMVTLALAQPSLNSPMGPAGTSGPPALGSGGEFLTILLFNLAGMLLLPSTRDLVFFYIALELATIPLFLLTAWRRDSMSGEAGLKYVVVGALASALLLYGLGLLYGIGRSTDMAVLSRNLFFSPFVAMAAGLVFAGLGFKLTLVPFHTWAPEVYQGAPTPITAWLSVASKTAGLSALMLLCYRVFPRMLPQWTLYLALLATLTMTAGNLAAIVQNNIKRFMAFSAVSQAGYLIMGFVGVGPNGPAAMVFYLLVYAVTNLAVFSVIALHHHQTGKDEISAYRGLSQTNPQLALAMMVGLFGLAGIPPLAGFVGKFFLFSVASKAGLNWLVGIAAVNSTISLYYYLRIVRQMYIEKPDPDQKPLQSPRLLSAALVITTAASLALGVVPWFYESIRFSAALWLDGMPK